MLDLVGYDSDLDLANKTIVEPSCGTGGFLLPIVDRLIGSCRDNGRPMSETSTAIRAHELLAHNAEIARKEVAKRLLEVGETIELAEQLASMWVTTDDFLLADYSKDSVDFVVGNPPYIRLEDLSKDLRAAYRSAWPSMWGRADIYVGFFEKGLALLKPNAKLMFVCADRWMHNQYGARLRSIVSDQYAMDCLVVAHDADLFEHEVAAYPAITLLRHGEQAKTRIVETRPSFNANTSQAIRSWVRGEEDVIPISDAFDASELDGWFAGDTLWPTGSPNELELISELEGRFSRLEASSPATRIGIGVATGCDEIYIQSGAPDVEEDRLLPLTMSSDLSTGGLEWSGRYLVSPWAEGRLVDLDLYPRLAAFYGKHGKRIRGRHVAKKRPDSWYRTIDRIDPELRSRPKLLLPDLKASSHPVLDRGDFYPHHNLCYVVSEDWDLEVLGGILLSGIADLFVRAYCVKMRGGTLRFQAQYVRQIRVPSPGSISDDACAALRRAFQARDREAANRAAAAAYGIDRSRISSGDAPG